MRRFVRHPTDIPIEVRAQAVQPGSDEECFMTTVSQGGLSCEVAQQLEVGAVVDVDILSVSPPYHGHGEIMWCRVSGSHFEVGVRFTDKEEAFKSRMVQQVCQIEQYKNMVYQRDGRLLDGDEAAAEWIEKYAAEFT